ncbi:hypothetical protein F5X96DRAFT_620102 [Biscogniauxia mediterranea]|nr:hypothetical protein F5X96DRAFT_620102 [Biscogniauxia mediterranea]
MFKPTVGSVDEPFASATLGEAFEWPNSWIPMAHLIEGRIQDLEHLAEADVANLTALRTTWPISYSPTA